MAVEGEFHGLVLNSRGTLSESEASQVLEFIEAREYTLALETLCGFLLDHNRRVTPELYIRIHSLSERLDDLDPYIVESVKAIVVSGE